MRSVALLPAIAILCGTYAGIVGTPRVSHGAVLLLCLWCGAMAAWICRWRSFTVVTVLAAYALAGVLLGAASARDALTPSIRTTLDAAYGGFLIETLGPSGSHARVLTRARLIEDAAPRDFGVSIPAQVDAIKVGGQWRQVTGGVRLTVSGTAALESVDRWRSGRRIEAPVTFRRPARYLNDGVRDFERDAALDGISLTGSVKSGLLVEVVDHGSLVQQAAASVRAHVRAAVARHIGARDALAGAIVTAILIGDRTALPDDIRERLQAAGTYHVIAISGGNIAILAAVLAAVLLAVGAGGRSSALVMMSGLAAYALIVSAGPSVWRATVTAIVYLAARLLDHHSPSWNVLAVSVAVLACAAPPDVRDVGFALTFGATAAILEAAGRIRRIRGRGIVFWITASVAASVATEIVLLPIGASVFSRATVAGLALNLLAVPLMTMAQIAGLAVVALGSVEIIGSVAGFIAAVSARGLVESARLVELIPYLAIRIPPPAPQLVVAYYVALAAALWIRRFKAISIALLAVCAAAIVTGASARIRDDHVDGRMRLDVFDVGQGDALLLQMPNGRTLMVDSGGAGIDGTAFDIGGRVLAPALWARGVMHLDALAITHGDPDHIGGALSLIRDFAPADIWHGVPMPRHPPSVAVVSAGAVSGAAIHQRLAGWSSHEGGAHVRVLHPPVPDWERPRVRNDDSIVLEVRYGDVAMLLTGDVSADVEQRLLPMLSPARIRILKAAHHGSRTSTSQALLEAWKPQIAVISCGRGNRFGHPAPEVIARLEASGVQIYRTDRHGQITVDTDGQRFSVRTYLGGLR